MDVAVDGHRSADFVVALHAPNGDGHVVNHAETFAMVGIGVMKSSADADANLIGERLTRGENRSSGGQPESVDEVARVRNFHFHFFERGERTGLQSLDVIRLVNEQDVLVARGLRLQEILRDGDGCCEQTIADAAILFGGKNVHADGEEIRVAVNKLEGEHEERYIILSTRCHSERRRSRREGIVRLWKGARGSGWDGLRSTDGPVDCIAGF